MGITSIIGLNFHHYLHHHHRSQNYLFVFYPFLFFFLFSLLYCFILFFFSFLNSRPAFPFPQYIRPPHAYQTARQLQPFRKIAMGYPEI